MADIVPLNKSIIQDAANCMRLAYLRVRDRVVNQDGEASAAAAEEIRLMWGNKVGQKARQQFPNGKLIQAENFAGMLSATQAALSSGDPILFEAAFSFEGIGIKVDVLRQSKSGKFDLIEVKSGTDPKKYLEDVAIQIWVLKQLGIKARPFLMTLDKAATIKSKSLFQIIDCNQEVRKLMPTIDKRIKAIRASVRAGKLPDVPFVRGCRECDYFGECLPKLPEHHVFTLYRGGKRIDDLLDQGILSLKSIPKTMELTEKQVVQVASIKTGKPWASEDLASELQADIEYPLFFLDFEAVGDPIPEFPRQHPYSVLPFQWSCLVQKSAGAEPEHREFLMDQPGDPRPVFAESLLRCLGDKGSIVVYTQYEGTAIKALAETLPIPKARLKALLPRLFDLHAVVKNHFYHPEFKGSFSIKKVLPVLVPEMSYDGLDVGDGMEAVRAYYRLISGRLSLADHAELSKSLRKYCKLDTQAMVKVYDALRSQFASSSTRKLADQ